MLKPLSAKAWNQASAAHLLNRAGFGGTRSDVQKLAALTPDQAVSRLLDYENIPDETPNPDWAKPNPEEVKDYRDKIRNGTPEEKKDAQREYQQTMQRRMLELRGWWLKRMAYPVRGPLQGADGAFLARPFCHERGQGPQSLPYMWRQNDLFRREATGNWEKLLVDYRQRSRDALSGSTSSKAAGIIRTKISRARSHGAFRFGRRSLYRARHHYRGRRAHSRVGRSNRTRRISVSARSSMTTVTRPSSARPEILMAMTSSRSSWSSRRRRSSSRRNCGIIFPVPEPDVKLNEALAANFRANNNDFKPFLRMMFRCEEFYSPDIVRNQVKSPVQWLVGSVRMLE